MNPDVPKLDLIISMLPPSVFHPRFLGTPRSFSPIAQFQLSSSQLSLFQGYVLPFFKDKHRSLNSNAVLSSFCSMPTQYTPPQLPSVMIPLFNKFLHVRSALLMLFSFTELLSEAILIEIDTLSFLSSVLILVVPYQIRKSGMIGFNNIRGLNRLINCNLKSSFIHILSYNQRPINPL